jgi:hypothetical protein
MNNSPAKIREDVVTIATIRRILLVIFLLGTFGTGAELLLLGHTENVWQWIPVLLILISLVTLLCYAAVRRLAIMRIFQVVMILFMISGVVGLVLHYRDKMEFKLETNPDLAGWHLFREVIKGATLPPVLAPGVMIQIGLLGLAYTYRHPIFKAITEKTESALIGE